MVAALRSNGAESAVAAPLKWKDSVEGKSTSQGKFTQMEDLQHIRGLSTIPRYTPDTGQDHAGLREEQEESRWIELRFGSYGWV